MQYENGKSDNPYFVNFTHSPGNSNSINNGTIWAIQDDSDGNLRLGIEQGGFDFLDLSGIDIGNPVFRHIKNNISEDLSFQIIQLTQSL